MRSELAQTAVVSLFNFGALLLLAVVLAYWTWHWIAPRAAAPAQHGVEASAGVASAYALFGSTQRNRDVTAPTGMAIRLLGVAAAARGQRGYAVLQLESKEILSVREGGDIVPGVRLAEVYADHVVIERNAARETLSWETKQAAQAAPAPGVPLSAVTSNGTRK